MYTLPVGVGGPDAATSKGAYTFRSGPIEAWTSARTLEILRRRFGYVFETQGGGLYHAAIRYPTRAALVTALERIRRHDYPVSHGSDHGASESIYLTDPDGNGLELYWDRPLDEWPRTPDGKLALVNLPLDLEALLSR